MDLLPADQVHLRHSASQLVPQTGPPPAALLRGGPAPLEAQALSGCPHPRSCSAPPRPPPGPLPPPPQPCDWPVWVLLPSLEPGPPHLPPGSGSFPGQASVRRWSPSSRQRLLGLHLAPRRQQAQGLRARKLPPTPRRQTHLGEQLVRRQLVDPPRVPLRGVGGLPRHLTTDNL